MPVLQPNGRPFQEHTLQSAHGKQKIVELLGHMVSQNVLLGVVPMGPTGEAYGFGLFLPSGDGIVIKATGIASYHLECQRLEALVASKHLQRVTALKEAFLCSLD
jgi:hypothetical protein